MKVVSGMRIKEFQAWTFYEKSKGVVKDKKEGKGRLQGT